MCRHENLSDNEIRVSNCASGCKVYACIDCTNELVVHSIVYGCRADIAHVEALVENANR